MRGRKEGGGGGVLGDWFSGLEFLRCQEYNYVCSLSNDKMLEINVGQQVQCIPQANYKYQILDVQCILHSLSRPVRALLVTAFFSLRSEEYPYALVNPVMI